jgi:glycosyltransferase involved in cell wall biosynthesis
MDSMDSGDDMDIARITVLTDPSWAAGPGVRRWRAEFVAAAQAIGAMVEVVAAPAPAPASTKERAGQQARKPGPAGRALGRARLVAGRLGPTIRRHWPAASAAASAALPPQLAGPLSADLVLAESPAAASAVVDAVEACRLWCLALPPERSVPGEKPAWAAPLREPKIGGFITDSWDARDVLERALSDTRAAVVVIPPISKGDGQPLAGVAVQATGAPLDDADASSASSSPSGAPAQLELWAAMLSGEQPRVPPHLLYAARRLALASPLQAPGEALPWNPDDDLTPGSTRPSPSAEAAAEAVAAWPADPTWTAERQRAGLAEVLGRLPERTRATASAAAAGGPLRVGVIGYDLKFMRELGSRLDLRADLAVELDEWPGPNRRNGARTDELVEAAQTLVAEWARPNAVWLSHLKRPDQRLIVRLHRFELTTATVADIQIENVDAVVYIAPALGRRIRDELGWPAEKLVYLPNFVDVDWLDRPKLDGSRFTLAMIGAGLRVKRLDLALDLLARVRAQDPRFSLLVRGSLPHELPSGWRKPDERRFFQVCVERVEKDPLLRGAVRWDGFGRDMAAWLRGAGHVLSLSDTEGSHSALSEGMASGAVPVVRRWHGVEEIYDSEWIRADLDDAAAFVLASADETRWRQRSQRAREQMRQSLAPGDVVDAWHDLLHGDSSTATKRFGRPIGG